MKKNKGLTLIELIVSIVIFGIVVLGISMFNSHNTKTAIRSERSAKRIVLQETAVEEFKGWLKAAPVPGQRFDSLWVNGAVGDTLFDTLQASPDISAALVIKSFEPSQANPVTETGIYLEVSVFSRDGLLGINEETEILISRHN